MVSKDSLRTLSLGGGKYIVCMPVDAGSEVIHANPQFANPNPEEDEEYDFHLRDDSPCIDAGDPDAPCGDEPICDGQESCILDMGFYGGTEEASCIAQ